MTAKQELQFWLQQHRQVNAESERKKFFQNLLNQLDSKDGEGHKKGLMALQKSVQATRQNAEKSKKSKEIESIVVLQKSREEQELLQSLLERMAIPFKRSA